MSDSDLIAKTEEFKQQLDSATSDIRSLMLDIRFKLAGDVSDGEDADIRDDLRAELDELVQDELKQIEDVLSKILPQAFAVIKETSRREKPAKGVLVTPFVNSECLSKLYFSVNYAETTSHHRTNLRANAGTDNPALGAINIAGPITSGGSSFFAGSLCTGAAGTRTLLTHSPDY